MASLKDRIAALERAIQGTDESRVLDLLVRAEQGDFEARGELERLPNRDEILCGMVAVYLHGPADEPGAGEMAAEVLR